MEKRVVFINGILPRSGTHFLANLLCKHPHCTKSPVPEDGLLQPGKHLSVYAESLIKAWELQNPAKDYAAYKTPILNHLGKAMTDFLWSAKKETPVEQPMMVTKTPGVDNLHLFPALFPNEKLIVLVRDGRDLVESAVNSFNYDREKTIHKWAEATRTIMKYKETVDAESFLIVKYEDLYSDVEKEMKKILSYLGLDVQMYDFNAAQDLPVVGSSVFKRGDGNVHWWPVSKTDDFKPLERTANWTREDHEQFNLIAKDELEDWGYKPVVY